MHPDYFDISFNRISNVLEKAQNSPFWRSKFKNKKIYNISEFRHLPITNRKEINFLYDSGRWTELLTREQKSNDIIVSSGGKPFRSPFVSCFSDNEFSLLISTIRQLFKPIKDYKNGILILFPGISPFPPNFAKNILPDKDLEEYKSIHISGNLFKRATQELGIQTFCTGLRFLAYKVSTDEAKIESDRIFKSFELSDPSIIALSPKILRNVFFNKLKLIGKKFSDFHTKYLIIGGEKLIDSDYVTLDMLGSPRIINWIESGELGTIAYSNPAKPLTQKKIKYYMTCPSIFYETVDEHFQPLPFGRRGRVIVTKFSSHLQPLIRYDIEDQSRFIFKNRRLFLEKDIVKL